MFTNFKLKIHNHEYSTGDTKNYLKHKLSYWIYNEFNCQAYYWYFTFKMTQNACLQGYNYMYMSAGRI